LGAVEFFQKLLHKEVKLAYLVYAIRNRECFFEEEMNNGRSDR